MGLSTVHGAVHDHGGHILVQTGSDGTLVEIYLPQLDARVDHTAVEVSTRVALRGRDGSSGCIWVVDDETSICRFVERLLEHEGYEVHTFQSPVAALAQFEATPFLPDMILTDQTMPNLTGLELADAMLALRPDLPIVLWGGHHDVMDAQLTTTRGLAAFFPKPLNTARLLDVIRATVSFSG